MGTATNQMITRQNVNANIRPSTFFTNLSKCVLKKECATYDLITATGSRAENQCIPLPDISRTKGPMTFYYGIWNNKNSSAKLDSISVQIKSSGGSWTTIGSASLGAISDVKTGTISCEIPTNFDLAYPCYMRFYCGKTLNNQTWAFCFRNSANIKNLDSTYWGTPENSSGQKISNAKEVYSWTAYLTAPNEGYSSAVLNYDRNTYGGYGRSQGSAALFKIT